MNKKVLFVIAVAIPLIVGFLSAYITKGNMMVFDEIQKPTLTPPAFLFPIAWTILYILMGMASYVAAHACTDMNQRVTILIPYVIQLILNFAWSIIFFNGRMYGVAFICLVIMWAAILATIVNFSKVSIIAPMLMVPLLLWVTFAGYLNAGIFLLQS